MDWFEDYVQSGLLERDHGGDFDGCCLVNLLYIIAFIALIAFIIYAIVA